jgi:hypothetical protein
MSKKKSMKAEMKIVSPDSNIFRLYHDEREMARCPGFYWRAIEDTGGVLSARLAQNPEEDIYPPGKDNNQLGEA